MLPLFSSRAHRKPWGLSAFPWRLAATMTLPSHIIGGCRIAKNCFFHNTWLEFGAVPCWKQSLSGLPPCCCHSYVVVLVATPVLPSELTAIELDFACMELNVNLPRGNEIPKKASRRNAENAMTFVWLNDFVTDFLLFCHFRDAEAQRRLTLGTTK